ncbi:MAG: hypothetical protein DMG44_11970 [Acidobacteria bacterium]|nr:MAG: hypothetical protein DMG44_11970 [Acidobacteriota bacterium]
MRATMVKQAGTPTAMLTDAHDPGRMRFEKERRRSDRYPLVIPIHLKWPGPGGVLHSAHAQAREANLHGGLLEFMDADRHPAEGTEVELMNLVSGQTAKARISAIRRSSTGALLAVTVELLPPNEAFWGLTFQLKRTTGELLKLEHGMKAGDIDPYVLREFREAVDYIRKTAWAVQEWQERQVQKRDTATVIPLLVMERIRRGTQLYEALTADLKNHAIRPEASEIEDLFHAIERLYEELKQLN